MLVESMCLSIIQFIVVGANVYTGDPLHSWALAHSRAPLFTQPCSHCSHSRAPGEQWARLCVFTLHGCVQAARLCRGSPVCIGRCVYLCMYLFVCMYMYVYARVPVSIRVCMHMSVCMCLYLCHCICWTINIFELNWIFIIELNRPYCNRVIGF